MPVIPMARGRQRLTRPSVMPDPSAAAIELTIDTVPLRLQPAIDCIAFAIQTGVDTVAAVFESCGQRICGAISYILHELYNRGYFDQDKKQKNLYYLKFF